MRRATRILVVVAAVVALVLAGCGGNSGTSDGQRPDPASWAMTWEDVQTMIPDLETLGDPPDADVCEATVTRLRDARNDLYPAPDELVEVEVDAWMVEATSIFFECFEADIGADTVAESYAELDRLESEVATALETVQ